MNHVSAWVAMLGMALFQHHLALVTHLTRVARFQPGDVLLPGAGFCLGIVFGAAVIDWLASRVEPAGFPDLDSPGKAKKHHLAALLLLPAYAVGVRLFLFDGWIPLSARFATQIGVGFFLAASHWVFFTLIPRRWAAAAFCAALGGGYALTEIQRHILFSFPPEAPPEYAAVLHPRIVVLSALSLAAVLAPGMAAAARREPEPPVEAENPAAGWKASARVLLLVSIFFVLHGLVSSVFLAFYLATRVLDNAGLVMGLTIAAFAAAAWLFTRGFARGFRLIVTICGIVHLTVPAFSLFKSNVPILRFIHALAGPLNFLFTAVAMAALALTAPRRWRVLLITAPLVIKAAAVLFIPPLLRPWRDSEVVALIALLTAVAFFVYGQKIDPSVFAGDAAPVEPDHADRPAPASVPDETDAPPEHDDADPAFSVEESAGDDAGAKLHRVIEELGVVYGFSGRESEVAELLASGLPADAIGDRLGLAPPTVHTYVRRVVKKTGHAGRKGFVAMVRVKLDAED